MRFPPLLDIITGRSEFERTMYSVVHDLNRIQTKGLRGVIVPKHVSFNYKLIGVTQDTLYGVSANNRAAIISYVDGIVGDRSYDDNENWEYMVISLNCGCKGSWKRREDVPHNSIECIHNNYLIYYTNEDN